MATAGNSTGPFFPQSGSMQEAFRDVERLTICGLAPEMEREMRLHERVRLFSFEVKGEMKPLERDRKRRFLDVAFELVDEAKGGRREVKPGDKCALVVSISSFSAFREDELRCTKLTRIPLTGPSVAITRPVSKYLHVHLHRDQNCLSWSVHPNERLTPAGPSHSRCQHPPAVHEFLFRNR